VVRVGDGALGLERPSSEGVWIAYYGDWSGVAVFPSELAALRHSVDGGGGMMVAFCPFGAHMGPGAIVVEGLVGGP
jgi:hypothetical protein